MTTPWPQPPHGQEETPLIREEEILGRNAGMIFPGMIRSAMGATNDIHKYMQNIKIDDGVLAG